MARTRPDAYQIEPGAEGEIMRVVGGVVTWVGVASVAADVAAAASAVTEAKLVDATVFATNGTSSAFALASAAVDTESIHVYLDGLRLRMGAGHDYTVIGPNQTVVMEYVPASGQNLVVDYRLP